MTSRSLPLLCPSAVSYNLQYPNTKTGVTVSPYFLRPVVQYQKCIIMSAYLPILLVNISLVCLALLTVYIHQHHHYQYHPMHRNSTEAPRPTNRPRQNQPAYIPKHAAVARVSIIHTSCPSPTPAVHIHKINVYKQIQKLHISQFSPK